MEDEEKSRERQARAKSEERPTLPPRRAGQNRGWGTLRSKEKEEKDPPVGVRKEKKKLRRLRLELVAGGVVAGFGVDVEGRQALGGAELDFDFAPAGVMNFVARAISQNILVTQLHADF